MAFCVQEFAVRTKNHSKNRRISAKDEQESESQNTQTIVYCVQQEKQEHNSQKGGIRYDLRRKERR